MRAFKQFLSLVLVTCMLTSMVTLVSADYAFTSDQKWDSDSGHIKITQDAKDLLDSQYTRVKDSGVDVKLDEFEVDLTKEKVAVTITGAKLADSGYTLKVYDSAVNLLYESETPVTPEANEVDEDQSDTQAINFSVSSIIMAAGSILEVYRGEETEPGWKIQYTAKATGVKPDQPVEIPPIVDEDKNTLIPSSAVNAVLAGLG